MLRGLAENMVMDREGGRRNNIGASVNKSRYKNNSRIYDHLTGDLERKGLGHKSKNEEYPDTKVR